MSEFGQGLTLSGIGILITFGALGTLILLILVLKTLFPGRVEKLADSNLDPTGSASKAALRKRAAAAGVAALLAKESKSQEGNLGKILETPPGDWWRKRLDRIHGKE